MEIQSYTVAQLFSLSEPKTVLELPAFAVLQIHQCQDYLSSLTSHIYIHL